MSGRRRKGPLAGLGKMVRGVGDAVAHATGLVDDDHEHDSDKERRREQREREEQERREEQEKVEAEKKRLEEEQKKLAAEKAEHERQQQLAEIDAAKKQAEAEAAAQQQEIERQRLEMEKQKMELEKQRIEMEREQMRIQAEQEEMKRKAEEQAKKLKEQEEEQKKLEEEEKKRQEEEEKQRLEEEAEEAAAAEEEALKQAQLTTVFQPFPSPRQSIKGKETYSNDDALQDCRDIKHALGRKDMKTIINITGSRTLKQRLLIKHLYGDVAGKAKGGKGDKKVKLVAEFRSAASGQFKDTLVGCWVLREVNDARWMEACLSGPGYKTEVLVELLGTRSNEELKKMAKEWQRIYKTSLRVRLQEETNKLFGKGHFQTFCLGLLQGRRPETHDVDERAVKDDAERLNRKISQGKDDDAKGAFVDVFTTRSWPHIRALNNEFQKVSQKHTLQAAIKNAFGDGDTSKGMCTILEFATEPYDYWARKLRQSMKGLGTDQGLLRRIVLSRCEIDLLDVSDAFARKHGDGKTLKHWIHDDISGDNREMLLKLCGYD